MNEYEKKMEAIRLIADGLNPIPLRELADELKAKADLLDEAFNLGMTVGCLIEDSGDIDISTTGNQLKDLS